MEELHDQQMAGAALALHQVQNALRNVECCLLSLPEQQRERVRSALRDAVRIGELLQTHRVDPAPIDQEGKMILGRALRQHLLHVQELRAVRDHQHKQVEALLATSVLDTAA